MPRLPRLTVALAIATSLALTALPAAQASGPPDSATAPAATSVADTARATHPRWTACADSLPNRAHCTTISVPRNWAAPTTSGIYHIAVARIPARSGASLGMFSFNPGGPGAGGLGSLSFVYDLLPGSIKDNFDIVAWDPRGIGGSGPHLAGCANPWVAPPTTGPVDWSAYTEKLYARVASAAQACLAKNAKHANNIGTWQVIRDLDAIRATLGERDITFWGMSYGTTVGRAYAQQFPDRVRALLLDGTITPTPSITGYSREHIWDDATGVTTMVGTFGKSLVRTYRQGMAYLENHVLSTPKGTPITRWDVVGQLTNMAAYQTAWPDARWVLVKLRKAMNARSARSTVAINELATFIDAHPVTWPLPRARGSSSSPAFTFINCSDMPDRPTAAVLAKVAEQAAGVGGTAYGMTALGEGLQCAGLPTLGTAVPALTTPLRLATPPVVVNSVADNRTPWLGARNTANMFTGSSMITYAGTQHVSYGRISACITLPVTEYFLTRTLPARSIACPLVAVD